MALSESVEIAGRRVPLWFILAGGAAVLLGLVAGRREAGKPGEASASGLLLEEFQAALGEERSRTEQAISEQANEFKESVLGYTSHVESLISGEEAQTRETFQRYAEASGEERQRVLESIREQSARIDSLLHQYGSTNPVLNPQVSGNRPQDSEIISWAEGIRLPVEWGRAYVEQFGYLPQNIESLNTWMGEVGYRQGDKFCVAGVCI